MNANPLPQRRNKARKKGSSKSGNTVRGGKLKAVLWIRIQIRMFFGLLDPDPLVGGTDPDPDPSIIRQ